MEFGHMHSAWRVRKFSFKGTLGSTVKKSSGRLIQIPWPNEDPQFIFSKIAAFTLLSPAPQGSSAWTSAASSTIFRMAEAPWPRG